MFFKKTPTTLFSTDFNLSLVNGYTFVMHSSKIEIILFVCHM